MDGVLLRFELNEDAQSCFGTDGEVNNLLSS